MRGRRGSTRSIDSKHLSENFDKPFLTEFLPCALSELYRVMSFLRLVFIACQLLPERCMKMPKLLMHLMIKSGRNWLKYLS